ncbi:MAG: TonB-dependent receptor, partial [Bacteroidetes bacterium]
INLDPFVTERTEIRFGPGSVLYGSDAIGGVMSFSTLSPQLAIEEKQRLSGKAITRYSSANGERTTHLDLQLGRRRWAALSSISFWDFDHLRQGRYGPDDYLKPFHVRRQDQQDLIVDQDDPLRQIPSAYHQYNLLHKLRFQASKHWVFHYAFHHSATSPYGRYDRHNRLRNGQPRYAVWDYGPQTWTMHHWSAQDQQPTALYDQLHMRVARQHFSESRIVRHLHATQQRIQVESVVAWSANVDFSKAWQNKQDFHYGLELVRNVVQSTGQLTDLFRMSTQVGPSRYPQATWQSLALYGLYGYRPSERLGLEAGIRYNYLQLEADFSNNLAFYPLPQSTAELINTAWTAQVGIHYHPHEQWVLKGNMGTAFRAPNVDDVGKVFDSEPGAVVVPNTELDAEYADHADVNVQYAWGQRLGVTFSTYYIWLRNALVRRPFQLDGRDSIPYAGELSQVQAIQNATWAQVYGWQVGFKLRLARALFFNSDFNYQYGTEQIADGSISPTRHAAPAFGISRLSYRTSHLQLQAYVQYQARRDYEQLAVEERHKDEIYAKDERGLNYAPAWYTLNLKARYQWVKGLALTVGLENITDQRYRPYSSGISGAGRNLMLTLEWRFASPTKVV